MGVMEQSRRISLEVTRSLRPKEYSRSKHEHHLRKDDESRFIDHALPTLKNGTVKDIHAKMQTHEYERTKYRTEKMILEMEEEDERRRIEERDHLRQTMLDKDRSTRATHAKMIEDMTTKWKATQMVKRNRTIRDLQFELATQKINELKTLKSRQIHDEDNKSGVVNFERNLKRLGIGGGDGGDVRLSVSYEANEAFEKRLQTLALDSMPQDAEINDFMGQLKDRTAEKRAARYEKARRRRRALVDQGPDNAENFS